MNDEQAKRQHDLDEAMTSLSANLPPMWRCLYLRLIEEGFNGSQAFSLLKCFIMRDGMNGVHIHKD